MAVLGMKPGEVYNQKKLNERLSTDDDAVSNVYLITVICSSTPIR